MLRIILWAALLAGVGAGAGLVVAKFTTPIYEARTMLLTASDVNPVEARGEAVTMLRSATLFQRAVERAALRHPELNSTRQALLLPSHGASEGEGGGALMVSVQSPKPGIAADVANAIVDEYNDQASKSNTANVMDRRDRLARQSANARARVDKIQRQIARLKEKFGIIDVDTTIQTAANYEATLSQQSDSDRNQLEALKNKLASEQDKYDAMAPTTAGTVVEAPNPKLVADTAKLQELQAKRVELLGIWLPTSKQVGDVDTEIQAQQQLIAQDKLQALSIERKETEPNPARLDIEKAIAQDTAQIASLNASLSEVGKAESRQKLATRGLPADEAQMLDLQRELDLANARYKEVRKNSDALDVDGSANQLPLLTTFLAAEPPNAPVWPDTNRIISVGAAIGIILGILVGISTNQRAEQLETVQQQTLAASPTLPELPMGIAAPPLPARRGDALTTLADRAALPAEAYRFMVFSMLSAGEDPVRTVLFTGVSSDSLCSEAAAQFAIAMSQSGIRTLLADCNLRDHSLTEAFGFKGKSGISDMLSRTMLPNGDSDLVLATDHPDLFFMPSGSEESDGLGGYANLQINGLVQDLKDRADVKVLNLPACASVADAPRLVRFADNVCLVASKADKSRGLVAKAHEILKRAGASEVDVLVIDRDEARDSFLG